MQFKNFTLDPFQEQAISAIENNFSVVVSAPTGSGKTLIADFIIEKHRNDPQRIIYTAPIKALSNQKYKDFSREYGEESVGLMTGDIVINPEAKVVIMTTEIYRNMAVSKDPGLHNIAYVIFDEIHYINDIERGYVWEESVIYSDEKVRFLCLSATIPNAEEFSRWIQSIKHHTVKTVLEQKRNVPLRHLFYDYETGIASLEKIREAVEHGRRRQHQRKGRRIRLPEPSHVELLKELGNEKLPCFFFTFSRRDCQEKARELAGMRLFPRNPQLLEMLNRQLAGTPPDLNRLNSTRLLKETIPQGIAFHHAGLLPVVKQAVEDLFSQGAIRVLYTTETFAVGINMPAKTVCFSSLRKFDGRNFRSLNSKEYFQIAGRAGRRGIDPLGFVVSMIFRPTFNYHEINRVTNSDVEPIQSQFRLSVNTVLNLVDQHTPEETEKILRLSFYSYQQFGERYKDIPTKVLLARYNSILRSLRKLGYMEDYSLTWKGKFSSRIYADEITIGEIFATEMYRELDEYQILLLIACLVYEPKEQDEFRQKFPDEKSRGLRQLLRRSEYLSHERKFLAMDEMSALINPVYHGKSFFDVLRLTNLLEGDLIRFYSQVLDRIGQIRKASTEREIWSRMDACREIMQKALAGIYLVG